MRRIVALICALIMVISVLFLFSSCSKTSKDIAIIYTNDIHAGIDDNLGLSSVAALKKEMIEKAAMLLQNTIGITTKFLQKESSVDIHGIQLVLEKQ